MRNLLTSTISILSFIALTACSSSSSGGDSTNANTDATPSAECATDIQKCPDSNEIFTLTNGTITVGTQTATANLNNHATLTAAASANDTVTLPAIAVLLTNTADYTKLSNVTYLDGGELNAKGVTTTNTTTLSRTDLSDSPYPTVQLTFDGANPIVAEIDADEPYTATADRSIAFGFTSEYMAFVEWNKAETTADFSSASPTKHSKQGMLIAGIETTNIPTGGATIFTGAGKGIYGVLDNGTYTPYNTTFTTKATVDFTNTSLDFSTTVTNCDESCTLPTGTDLDLTATGLDFADGNNISGAVSTDGLTGTLDARFYGNDDVATMGINESATEFGGTFALTSASNYYYGAFGGERGYLIETKTVGTTTASGANKKSTTSFNYTGAVGTIIILNIDNLIEITDNSSSKAITLNEVTGAEVNYYYGQSGFVPTVATISFATKNYEAQTTTGTSQKLTGTGVTGATSGVTVNNFQINRGSVADDEPFGFTGDYMALVSWNETATGVTTYGYGITGYETATLTASNIANFTGRGQGRYENTDGTNVNTFFNITATANFGANTVALESTDTCDMALVVGDCTATGTAYADLDFSGDLSYVGTANALSGTINTTGNALTGTADAKFYGTGADTTKEFGGTFRLSNLNEGAGYAGYFGGEFGWVADNKVAVATSVAIPAQNLNGATSYSNAEFYGKTLTALSVASTAQITTDSTAKTITTETFTGSAISYGYDEGSPDLYGSKAPKLYLGSSDYQVTAGEAKNESTLYKGTDVEIDGVETAGAELSLHRDDIFGFTADYMEWIDWKVGNTRGYGIAGFESASIPTTGTAQFTTGGGKGHYSDKDGTIETKFSITADVNFGATAAMIGGNQVAANTVVVTGTGTCDNSACGTKSRADLDFTGELSFTAGTNDITGTVTTTGDVNNDVMTGSSSARFYGPTSQEFGGTFSVGNSSAGYVGFFGAQ